jgi:hypothetical protein
MIDIGSSQICFLAYSLAELEIDCKGFFAAAFNFKFVFVASEFINRDGFLATTMGAMKYSSIVLPDMCFGDFRFWHDRILI